jgi:hypothetical protein
MTPWPGIKLPTPRLTGATYRLVDGQLLQWTGWSFVGEAERLATAERRRDEAISAVGEIHLELVRLDLDDDDAIVEFVNRFGILGISFNGYEPVAGFSRFSSVRPLLDASRSSPILGDQRGLTFNETLAEFRYGARCIRDLVAATDHLMDRRIGLPEWEALEGSVYSQDELEALQRAGMELTDDGEVRDLLRRGLNSGLQPFHPQLDARPEPWWAIQFTTPLYCACCLEIYNRIAAHEHPRVCANENCQRPFTRQRGGARKGQHRLTGVLYCSPECARAVASRNYRNRKRQKARAAAEASPEQQVPGSALRTTRERSRTRA